MIKEVANAIDSESPASRIKRIGPIPRSILPQLNLDHSLSKPKIDWLRLVVPRFSMNNVGYTLSNLLEDTIGCPFRAASSQKHSCVSDIGIIGFAERGGIRIEFTGKYWAMVAEEQEGLLRIQATIKNFQEKFRRFPHLTRLDVCRDIVGLKPLEVLRLPDADVWWSFVKDDFNPVNQYGGIHVTGSRCGWIFNIYDKSRELRDNCKDAAKYTAILSKWGAVGVDEQMTISRMELSLSTKATLKAFTVDLYHGELDPARVLSSWAQRKSIYICPVGKNTDVAKKTKQNTWANCPRFQELMCQPNAQNLATPTEDGRADSESKNGDLIRPTVSGMVPPLNFHDPLYNQAARVKGVVCASIIRLSPLNKLLYEVHTAWGDGVKDRAKTLANKIRSASYIAPIEDIKSDIRPRELLFDGLSQLHSKLWMAGHFRLANDLCVHLKNLYIKPDCNNIRRTTTEVIQRCLLLILNHGRPTSIDGIANNSRTLETGTVCDGYTDHKNGSSSPLCGDSDPTPVDAGEL